MARSALIVDDSRVALATLKRMLEAHGIVADTVESGPEALDYLHGNAPGIVFLDHMMPGMDGFETLAALKNNRQTAAIPVIMYTSQEGEAYMAQALALGAVGVLHKPTTPNEVTQILRRVETTRTANMASTPPAPMANTIVRHSAASSANDASPASAVDAAGASEGGTNLGQARVLLYAALASALLLPGAWFYHRDQQSELLRKQLQQENLALKAAQASALAKVQDADSARTALDANDRHDTSSLLATVAWVFNQHGQYPFGSLPLNDARMSQVRDLVARLTDAGFQGTLQITVHSGEFCIQRDAQGAARLPRANLPLSLCEIRMQAPETAVQIGMNESAAFSRYVADNDNSSSPIQISVTSQGSTDPLVPYPQGSNAVTAGDWNRVAAQNQRVEIALVPTP